MVLPVAVQHVTAMGLDSQPVTGSGSVMQGITASSVMAGWKNTGDIAPTKQRVGSLQLA
jgi:hypothetical protein